MDFNSLPKARRFEKGDVFFIYEPEEITKAKLESDSSAYAKSRPYVFLSANNYLDSNSWFIYACPITTNTTPKYNNNDPMFIGVDGKPRRIIIDQLVSVERKYIRDYCFRIPEETLIECEKILIERLGFNKTLSIMEEKVKTLQNELDILKKNAYSFMQFAVSNGENINGIENGIQEIKDDIPEMNTKEDSSNNATLEEIHEVVNSIDTTQIPKLEIIPESKIIQKPISRNKWTRDRAEELIRDYENYSHEYYPALCNKYYSTSIVGLKQMYIYAKKITKGIAYKTPKSRKKIKKTTTTSTPNYNFDVESATKFILEVNQEDNKVKLAKNLGMTPNELYKKIEAARNFLGTTTPISMKIGVAT